MKGEKMNRDTVEETRELEREAETPGDRDTEEPGGNKSEHKRGGEVKVKEHKRRARGGGLDAAMEHKTTKIKRKGGGKVPGMKAMERPDRRARGGAMSDTNPFTSAGKVSVPDYESKSDTPNGGGMGPDKSPYKGGGHRRPG